MCRAATLLVVVAAASLTATARAQHPTPARVVELVRDYPQLQNPPDPFRSGYLPDPMIRKLVASPEFERAYTLALQRLASAELIRSLADEKLESAIAVEQTGQDELITAQNSISAAQLELDRAQRSAPPDGDGAAVIAAAKAALARAQDASTAAKGRLSETRIQRQNAEEGAKSADSDFQKVAADELDARTARNGNIKPDVLEACSSQGYAIQRNTILVRFADSASKTDIDAVMHRNHVHPANGGLPEISLFIVELDPPLRGSESDRDHYLRLMRTIRALAAETQYVVSATQAGTLHATTARHILAATFVPHPCWSWFNANTSGTDSASLIRLKLAWASLIPRPVGAASVSVAILDAGFVTNDDLPGLSAVCPQSLDVHGSRVAGMLVGASGNNALPANSVPFAQIATCGIPILPIDCEGDDAVAFISTILALRNLIVTQKPRIVNVSLGYNWVDFNKIASADSDIQDVVAAQGTLVRDLLAQFTDVVLVVSAAGNDCHVSTCTEPAMWSSPINWAALAPMTAATSTPACANVVVVEAVNSSGGNAAQSNRGGSVRAPGETLLTCEDGANSSIQDGTSLAAPIVSGVAALMLTANPALKPAQVAAILQQPQSSNALDAASAVQTAQTTH